jgi:molybdopterin-guanine dinucleotide biosynthesis protein A
MGLPKHRLPFGNLSLLQHALKLLGTVTDVLIVVAAQGQPVDLDEHILIVHDEHPDRGPLEGLAIGLAAAEPIADRAFLMACDTPLLVPSFVSKMDASLADHDAVTVDDGQFRHPLGAIYRTKLATVARAQLDRGERSLQGLLDQCDTGRVTPESLSDVDPDLRSLRNLNTPAEYLAVVQEAGLEVAETTLRKLGLS